jgi:hypothetical protein
MMGMDLTPDPELAEVLHREILLLKPGMRADADAVLALLHPDFLEFGASGRVWDATSLIEALAEESENDATSGAELICRVEDPVAVLLAPGVVLLTYTAHEPDRVSRRSSVWVRDSDGPWLLRFHQGTVILQPDDADGGAAGSWPDVSVSPWSSVRPATPG